VPGTDNAIHVFDSDTFTSTITIQQHTDWVTAIAFNTNGTQIASASRDRTARVYDATSGNLETTYTGQNSPLYAVAFLPDGLVASGGRDKSLHIWDSKEGKKKSDIGGSAERSTRFWRRVIFFQCFGRWAGEAACDFGSEALVHTFTGHGDAVYALAYDPASKKLVSGSYDGVVNLWNVESGALEKTFVAAPGWSFEQVALEARQSLRQNSFAAKFTEESSERALLPGPIEASYGS
jgi:WD40 repeat protein